jgi:ankyrin repeat protein
MMSVMNQQYNVCKTLLQLGANPNVHDRYNGSSAMICAAEISTPADDDTKFLRLLLQYKGNPNDVETGPRQEGNTTRKTPLIASLQINEINPSLPKVKLLVEHGADINYQNEFGQTVLKEAVILDDYEVVLYLLHNGADYNMLIVDRAQYNPGGKKMYLVDMLREYLPPLDSKEHKIKMQIVDFLLQKNIDYKKIPVPDYTLKEIKETYPDNWEEYVEKY